MSGVRGWFSARRAPAAEPLRWVVADVETSGLDPKRDRLLAVAGMAVQFDAVRRQPRLVPGDSFEARLRQPASSTAVPDRANILLHGIGVAAQRDGADPATALAAWHDWVGDAPLVGYHSAFDDTALRVAARQAGVAPATGAWLDLEPLCAVLHQQPRRQPLDHWLSHHGIDCLARHDAAADVLATAQLLAALWPRVRQRCDGQAAAVRDLADGARFLAGRG